VTGGSMSLSRKRAVTKLVALPGQDFTEDCGTRLQLVGKPKLKSYKAASERWALARVRKGLFVPTPVKLKTDKGTVAGAVKLIWDSPTRASGQFRFSSCVLNFELRAK
jgi:hypothetical protein